MIQRHRHADAVAAPVRADACAMMRPLLTRLRWVSSTPLGEPVVPEVYWMLTTSWPRRGGARSRIAACEHGVPRRLSEPNHVLGRWRFRKDRPIVGAGVAGVQEERANARFLQHEAQLVRTVCRVDVDQHDPGARGPDAETPIRRSWWPRSRRDRRARVPSPRVPPRHESSRHPTVPVEATC